MLIVGDYLRWGNGAKVRLWPTVACRHVGALGPKAVYRGLPEQSFIASDEERVCGGQGERKTPSLVAQFFAQRLQNAPANWSTKLFLAVGRTSNLRTSDVMLAKPPNSRHFLNCLAVR